MTLVRHSYTEANGIWCVCAVHALAFQNKTINLKMLLKQPSIHMYLVYLWTLDFFFIFYQYWYPYRLYRVRCIVCTSIWQMNIFY